MKADGPEARILFKIGCEITEAKAWHGGSWQHSRKNGHCPYARARLFGLPNTGNAQAHAPSAVWMHCFPARSMMVAHRNFKAGQNSVHLFLCIQSFGRAHELARQV